MSRLSRALLYDPDERAASTLAFGLEREGIKVAKPADGPAAVQLAVTAGDGDDRVDVAVLGGDVEVVRALRAKARMPILYLGREEHRAAALAAGANDVLSKPVFVRDVLTLARLHAMRRNGAAATYTGELGDFYNLFYLVRALATAKRTGVLTLLRGGRRGELRFYEGEVTSAHTGLLHGLAALHQLLLWTEGRFELRNESIVRRQQIPLQPAELFEDAQRFLRDFRELGADLSPSAVYEQDVGRVSECVDDIPKEVSPVLRLFDGVRTIADVVEDSPFRPFETVKIAVKLVELDAVKRISTPRARSGAAAALAIEDWLIGNATPSNGVPAVATLRAVESQPALAANGGLPVGAVPAVPAPERKDKDKKKKKKRKDSDAEAKDTAQRVLDWGPIVTPSVSMWEGQGYAPVVPAQSTAGEIEMGRAPEGDKEAENRMLAAAAQAVAEPERPRPVVEGLLSGETRERLEQVLDREQRASLFADGPAEMAQAVPIAVDAPVETAPSTDPIPKVDDAATEPITLIEPAILAEAPPPEPKAAAVVAVAVITTKSSFDDIDEEFFRQSAKYSPDTPQPPTESFDDLDEGEPPPRTFWQRVFKKQPEPPPTKKPTPGRSPGPAAPKPKKKR